MGKGETFVQKKISLSLKKVMGKIRRFLDIDMALLEKRVALYGKMGRCDFELIGI